MRAISVLNPAQKSTRTALILCTVLYLVYTPVWLFVAGMSVMLFDAPGSESVLLPNVLFYGNGLYPFVALASVITGWVLYARHRYKQARLWVLLPLLWVVPVVALLVFVNVWG